MSQIDETVAKRAHKVSDGRTDGTSRCVIDLLQLMQKKSLRKIIAGSKTSRTKELELERDEVIKNFYRI